MREPIEFFSITITCIHEKMTILPEFRLWDKNPDQSYENSIRFKKRTGYLINRTISKRAKQHF